MKVRELVVGQRVQVESKNGPKKGTVLEIRERVARGETTPTIWVTVGTKNGGFIDSMHEPDGEIDVLD